MKVRYSLPRIYSKRLFNLIFFIVFSILLSSSAFATDYYVDNVNGLNTNSGTSVGAAWKTLAYSAPLTFGGDTLYIINNGALNPYRERLYPARAGADGSLIRFIGYNGSPVLLGTVDYTNSVATGWIWLSSGVSGEYYLTKNGANPLITQARVLATSLTSSWNSSGVDSLYNRNMGVIGSLTAGQWAWGDNDALGYSTIYYKLAADEADITAVHIEAGEDSSARRSPILNYYNYIYFEDLKILFSNNSGVDNGGNYVVYNAIDSSYTGRSGISINSKNHITITNSKFDHNGLSLVGDTTGIMLSGTSDCIISNNVVSNGKADSGINIKAASNRNLIEKNILFNNFQHGIDISTNSVDNDVYNNTIYNNAGTGINIESTSTGNIIKNNVAANNQNYQLSVFDSGSLTGLVMNNNAYYFTSPTTSIIRYVGVFYTINTFSTYKSDTGMDANSLAVNPNFLNTSGTFSLVGDYKLLSTSSLINAGTSVGLTTDYIGTAIPQGATEDIGAYEFFLPSTISLLEQYKANGSTIISSGGWINETSVVIKFDMSSNNASDNLTPQVEIQEIGTAFTNTPTNSGNVVAYSGSPVLGEVLISGLISGKTYHWQARSSNTAGQSAWSIKGGNPDFGIDTSGPTTPGEPSTTTPTTDSTPTWTWTASTDSISGLFNPAYTVEWCTNEGFAGCGSNIAMVNSASYTNGASLVDGTWYFRVKATDIVGNISEYSINGSVVIDTALPEIIIVNPDTSAATIKTITASTNEGILTMSTNSIGVSTCDDTLTFISYYDSNFTAESDNGRTICFRAIDDVGNKSYLLSDVINGIDQTGPIILTGLPIISSTEITIIWTTNENSSSQINYGLTNSYGESTLEYNTVSGVENHSITITGLLACTTYYYQIRSRDIVLNETLDSNHVLTTLGCVTPTATSAPSLTPTLTPTSTSRNDINSTATPTLNLTITASPIMRYSPTPYATKVIPTITKTVAAITTDSNNLPIIIVVGVAGFGITGYVVFRRKTI